MGLFAGSWVVSFKTKFTLHAPSLVGPGWDWRVWQPLTEVPGYQRRTGHAGVPDCGLLQWAPTAHPSPDWATPRMRGQ